MSGQSFEQTLGELTEIPGWPHDDQARRLWGAASALGPAGRIVEIGNYQGRATIMLARAAPADAVIVSIDPHAGGGRSPGEWEGSHEGGQSDHVAFEAHLLSHGVADRVDHVCSTSSAAYEHVTGEIDLLYVDGSHAYGDALADLRDWGGRVREGGRMFVHDTYGSVFVTAAAYRSVALSSQWRYMGRERTLAEYRREPVRGVARLHNVTRQLAALPWFARNVAVKALCALRLERLAGVFGHRPDDHIY